MRLPPLTPEVVADAVHHAGSWLAHRRRATRTPGVQAAVWYDGDLVLSTAHGVADEATGEPLRTDHRFRVASHSKTMTATAVLQLAEADRLRLDDTLGDWLGWLVEDGSPLAERTLFQVLAHAGGVTRDSADAGHWDLTQPFPDADRLRRIAAEPAVTDPDVRFKYSNIGYALLGQVIDAAGGRPWVDHVQDAIIDRLGLADTGPDWPAGDDGPFATAHTGLAWADRRVPIEQVPTGSLAPATGVWSTAADLCRYGAAHLPGDDRLLQDASKRRMQRQVSTVEGLPDAGYGLGFMITHVGERRLVGHGGGWPGHITRTLIDPDARFVVSVLTNAIDGPATELADGIVRLIDLAASNAARSRLDGDGLGDRRPAVEALSGRYAWLWGVRDLVVLGDRAVLLDPGTASPTAVVTELSPTDDPDVLAMTAGVGYGAVGESVRAERDDDGEVHHLWIGGVRTTPIDAVRLPDRVSPA